MSKDEKKKESRAEPEIKIRTKMRMTEMENDVWTENWERKRKWLKLHTWVDKKKEKNEWVEMK